jgi:hypothetical protein
MVHPVLVNAFGELAAAEGDFEIVDIKNHAAVAASAPAPY